MRMSSQEFKECLRSIVAESGADFFYLPSFDHNLCEYVPVSDSLRIFVTGFTGSVAEAIVTKEGMIHLYVDGRYHEQADLECDPALVIVEKIPYGSSLREELLSKIKEGEKVAVVGPRTPLNLMNGIKESCLIGLSEEEVFEKLGFEAPVFYGPLWEVSEQSGKRFAAQAQKNLKSNQAAFINALDTLAWASGLRGAFLPYQGTFRGVAIMLQDALHIFVSSEQLEFCKEFETSWRKFYVLKDFERMSEFLLKDKEVTIDEKFTTLQNYWQLNCVVDSKKILRHGSYHAHWQAVKLPFEHQYFRQSFERSDRAIFSALSSLVVSARAGRGVTEQGLRNELEKFYKIEGARVQSFRTISGFGASSSIIHFGNPSAEKKLIEGEFVLLDSGAIYEQGFATDCTRTIIPLGIPSESQILHYTLVLKGLIKVMTATFSVGTLGRELDELARAPLKDHGLSFAHGTGHGVGVNVHEGGYSITPFSDTPMVAGLVGSIEPGYYEPGIGGIRLENIAIVKEAGDGQLEFENLVYIGFWHDLIDPTLLSKEELDYLLNYEAICLEKGRSFSHFAKSPLVRRN